MMYLKVNNNLFYCLHAINKYNEMECTVTKTSSSEARKTHARENTELCLTMNFNWAVDGLVDIQRYSCQGPLCKLFFVIYIFYLYFFLRASGDAGYQKAFDATLTKRARSRA
ncbi:hypothetical protein SK128_010939 [Halocaridina rubra]|uniref:Uncharacterized protein n=1 Tax=Halocaridina rubra TaxID=373956 RepID=A0AAN8ZZ39_HALRR